MSPLKLVENSPGEAVLLRGTPSWYCFKFVKYIIILVCLMLLLLIQQFSTINDNFTQVSNDTLATHNNSSKKNASLFQSVEKLITPVKKQNPGNFSTENKKIVPVKSDSGKSSHSHENSSIKLSDLLIMYPCCTAIAIILGMEMLGQALKDPMSKITSIILILLCVILSAVVFTISLMESIKTVQTTMIILAVLAVVFLLLEIVDVVLLLLS